MAFDARELSVLAYANGFTLWHYRTPDAAPALTLPAEPVAEPRSYFAPASDLLRPGDQIIVNMLGGNRPAIVNLVVTDVAGNVGVAAV